MQHRDTDLRKQPFDTEAALLRMEANDLTDTEMFRVLKRIWEEQTGKKWEPKRS